MGPRISVCIPTHNRSGLLQKTLKSLAAVEPCPDITWEIIVVANCCTDDTLHVVDALKDHVPVKLLIIEEADLGVVAARNRALRHARGEIIAFLDDDVLVRPLWLCELVKAFDSQQPDMLVGRVYLDWHKLSRPTWFDAGMGQYLAQVDLGDVPILLQNPLGAGANLAITRDMLQRIGGFCCPLERTGKRTAGEDTDLIARAMRAKGRVLYAPTVTVDHYVAAARLTVRYLRGVAFDVGMAEYLIAPSISAGELAANLGRKIPRLLQRSVRWLLVVPFNQRAAACLRVSLAKTRGNIGGIMLCAWRSMLGRSVRPPAFGDLPELSATIASGNSAAPADQLMAGTHG